MHSHKWKTKVTQSPWTKHNRMIIHKLWKTLWKYHENVMLRSWDIQFLTFSNVPSSKLVTSWWKLLFGHKTYLTIRYNHEEHFKEKSLRYGGLGPKCRPFLIYQSTTTNYKSIRVSLCFFLLFGKYAQRPSKILNIINRSVYITLFIKIIKESGTSFLYWK